MKHLLLVLSGCLLGITTVNAEVPKTLASTIDVYVFPKEGQQSDVQSQDEASCYDWAAENTGNDPFDLKKQSAEQAEETAEAKAAAEQTGKGAGIRGAVRGAAAGALVGEIIDDDASDGAEIGAAAGAIAGRRKARAAKAQAQKQAEQQGEAKQKATQEQIGNFKKAFSVCLEAKSYLVKY